MSDDSKVTFSPAGVAELNDLVSLEQACFDYDQMSKRSFRHHILSRHSDLWLAKSQTGDLLGYALVLKHQGTRLARLYSLAIAPIARGLGIAKQLLSHSEKQAAADERHYLRLEVAKKNTAAIALYNACGYRVFGEYADYYEDHSDALRMQKRIRLMGDKGIKKLTPWLSQNTEFTCGPTSLMMAMASLDESLTCSLELELDLWREATTIFMTSGHGGCHPFGLALSAQRRGFNSSVWLNTEQPLFVDGVRSEHKKHIMSVVHQQMLAQCQQAQVELCQQAISFDDIRACLERGEAVLILVSTYRLDGKKSPHWVVVTGIDERCLFVHDPDLDETLQMAIDCQYVPIAFEDFDKMASFGSQRLRAAVTIARAE
ncbi:MAG: GNAT family N-acetyltransferase/peptidase C39 family protein [Thalassotalea sp.]